jgi:hypothetical protein
LLKAVDALGRGGWLTLTEMARHWPDAERVMAPLKAADRLLRSAVLERGRGALYRAMTVWLIREPQPLIAVDWSDLKRDGRFKLLRAGLVVQGRTLTLWEEVHPQATAGSPAVERAFLEHLAECLPQGCRPIILSDAGFRRPWFRAVQAQGWSYVGRLRGRVQVQPLTAAPDKASEWVSCSALHELAIASHSRDLGVFRIGRNEPLPARLVVHKAPSKGRQARTVAGARRRDSASLDAARSASEPWVLVTSLNDATAAQIARYYDRRMTIEQGFRDLKSGTLGAGFEHSLTRKGHRLANLLVLFALSQFATWLVGLCEERERDGTRLDTIRNAKRRHYSTMRLGKQIIKRPAWWPPPALLQRFLRSLAKGQHDVLQWHRAG